MAATFALRASGAGSFNPAKVPGAFFDALLQVTGDASYPAGGYAVTAASIPNGNFTTLESVEVVNHWVSSTPTMFFAVWNNATGKIMAMATPTGAGAAVAAVDVTPTTTNLSTFTCTLRVRFC